MFPYKDIGMFGLFFKKRIREVLDPRDVTVSTLAVAMCALLIVVNVAFFALFPRLLAPMAVVFSNGVTVLLAFLAFRPASRLLQGMLEKRQEELLAKVEEERALRDQVAQLENRIRDLLLIYQ